MDKLDFISMKLKSYDAYGVVSVSTTNGSL